MTAANGDIDEGYVKYASHWTPGPGPDDGIVAVLELWRRPLYEAELIGHYPELGIGYGNLSVRLGDSDRFVISGTQTGHVAATTARHYSTVTSVDIGGNSLHCLGPVQASSEALTHAALYSLSAEIRAVVHVHSAELWQRHKGRLPTTDAKIAYGTPGMAAEFVRLWRDTDLADCGLAAMAGHAEGLVGIGATLEQATRRVLRLLQDG